MGIQIIQVKNTTVFYKINMNFLTFEEIDKYLLSQNGRIIHQVWFGTIPNKREATKTYDKFKKYRDSWHINNPTWCHMEWSKTLSDSIVKLCYPEYQDLYKKYPYEIQGCDMVRYCCLHRYGGIYADMDYFCNKSFDDALSRFSNDLYLVNTPNVGNKYVSNSLMYSKPGHPFWRCLLLEMEINKEQPIYYSRHLIIMYTTGPGILTRVFNTYKLKLKLKSLPHRLFHPHGISDDIMTLRNERVYAIHLGKGSWEKDDSKILIYLYEEWKILFFVSSILIIPFLILKIKINK